MPPCPTLPVKEEWHMKGRAMKKKMCEKERQTDERETEEREDLPVAGLLVQIAPTARWAGSQVLKVAGTPGAWAINCCFPGALARNQVRRGAAVDSNGHYDSGWWLLRWLLNSLCPNVTWMRWMWDVSVQTISEQYQLLSRKIMKTKTKLEYGWDEYRDRAQDCCGGQAKQTFIILFIYLEDF